MKVIIISGEYGSGKTEFTLNLALNLSKTKKVAVCDLDVINYYYRSRHAQELLEANNITLVGSTIDSNHTQDLPAVSFGAKGIINSKSHDVVIFDLAGSHNGTKVLASFKDAIDKVDYEFWMVVNMYRERTGTLEGILEVSAELEQQSKYRLTGFVNNSNLLESTAIEDIQAGQDLIAKAAKVKDIPIVCTFANTSFKGKLNVGNDVLYYDELIIRDKYL